jgi:hypothetical protein
MDDGLRAHTRPHSNHRFGQKDGLPPYGEEIIITKQINKFLDAATSLPSVSTFTLGAPENVDLRVGSGAV